MIIFTPRSSFTGLFKKAESSIYLTKLNVMKNWMTKSILPGMLLLMANLFFTGNASAQTYYYYKGTGNLASTTNWGTATDGSGAAPSNFTTANRIFNVRNTASVSTTAAWTVSGANSKIIVGDGSAATNLTVAIGSAINGTVDVSAAATLTLTNTTLPTIGTLNASSTVIFNGTGNQTIPVETYGNITYSGSATGTFSGTTTIAGNFSCTSGNVTFNTANGNRVFTVGGDFSISTTGTVNFGSSGGNSVINLSGNFSKTNGTVTTTGNTENGLFNMVGTTQTIESTGGTIMKWVDFNIKSGSTTSLVDDYNINGSSGTPSIFTVSNGGTFNTGAFTLLGTTTPSGNNSFVLSSGGTLGIGSAAGITTAGTATGSIRSLVRTYNVGGNYVYNGTTAQATGTGLPTNLTGSVTIDNPGNTVTLSIARTIANGGTVNLTNGVFAAASNLTMASTSTINRSEGSLTGNPQGAGIYNVNYTGNDKTTGSELNGSGLNNVNENLTATQTLTLGAAVTMDGNLTIASGTTLDVSGGNFAIIIAGNWTNNSGTFTPGAGTVTFTGTGTRSINGTATSQTFNNVIVNKTAGQLLNTGGSTTSVTTNALTLTQGNFTAPATLNVNGNLTHTNGTYIAGANTNVGGNWTRNGGTFTSGNNTVTTTGSSAQLINGSAATTFYNLTINEPSSATTVTSQTTAFSVSNNLTVTQGNLILQATDANYNIANNFIVSTNGTFTHSVNWDVAGKQITVGGNIDITGLYTYTVRSHIQMTGSGKTIRTGTAPASALSILTLSNATVTANGAVTVNDNFWAMFNTPGSFSTNGQTVIANSSLLSSGGTVNVNGGSLTVSGGMIVGGGGVNNGTINISSGTVVTDGITLGDVLGNLANTINQTGGTLTVNGAVTINQPNANGITNSWNINAATVDVSGLISFAGTNTTTSRVGRILITTGTLNANGGFSFAGTTAATKLISMNTGAGTGTINMKGALTGAANATLTAGTAGSTFNYSDNISTQTVNLFGTGAYNNLHINTTGGVGATLSGAITAGNVTGNLRVQSGSLNNGGFAIAGNASRTLEVANAAFLNLAGTTSAFPTGFGTVSLGVTSTVNYAGSGNQTIVAQNYGNLTTTLNGTRTVTLSNTGTIGVAGIFNPAAGTTSYTIAGSTVNFNSATGAQTIPAFSFNNLTVNNTAGVTLTGDVNVNGTTNALTFTNGKINTGAFTLALASNVTVTTATASKYVNGNLAWNIPTGTPTRTFYIGDANNYTPVDVTFTTNVTTGGLLTASTTGADHPQIASSGIVAALSVNRFWSLTNTTISPIGYTAVFNFIGPTPGSGDIDAGVNTSNVVIKRYDGAWSSTTIGTRNATNTQATVISGFGDFQIGEDCFIDAPTSGGDQTVCFNGDIEQTITATATGGSITWYDQASGGNVVPLPTQVGVGTITYYAEASNGTCSSLSRTAVTLTINASPDAPVSGGDETVCYNGDPLQTLIATASSPSSITWYDEATDGMVVTPALIGIGTVTYYAEASNGTCESPTRTAVTLTINPVLETPGPITGPLDACPLIGSPTPSTYSIDPVAGATSYTWIVPVGTTLVSGQGTTSIDVTFDNSFALTNSRFIVSAQAPNACTSGTSILEVLKIVPGIPTVINGPNNACPFIGQPTTAVYSIDPVANATSYTWTVAGAATIASGQGTTSIEVNFLAGFTTGNVRVTANSNCGNRSPRSLNITKLSPLAPASITGPTTVCAFIGTLTPVNYSIDPVVNAVSYTWTLPANVSLISGQGTTSISVTFNSGFVTAPLKVKSVSNCASSGDRSVTLVAASASTPGSISGPTNACVFIGSGSEAVYTIRQVSNATSYNWSVPAGATIASHPGGAGVNDTIINVTFNNTFVSGTNITVQAVACNSSGTRSLSVTRVLPSRPSLISGATNACLFMVSAENPSGTPVLYTIPKVANATSYDWTAPSGATITAHPDGLGVNDTTIEITYSAGFVSGAVTVAAVNDCGAGAIRTLSVTRLSPGAPGGVTVVNTVTCPNREYTYTIPAVPSNATSVLWTVPAQGTIISGQGTASITVSYSAGAVVGTVTATGYNNCSNGSTRSININLLACPPGFAGKMNTDINANVNAEEKMSVSVSPNPTVTDFKLEVLTAGKEKINVRILDMQGRVFKMITVMPFQTVSVGAELKTGSYIVEVIQGKNKITQKLFKF